MRDKGENCSPTSFAQDPAVDTVTAFTGGGGGNNSGRFFAQLKPPRSAQDQRRRSHRTHSPKARSHSRRFAVSCRPCRTSTSAAASAGAQYQYTLQADNLTDLVDWAPRLMERMAKIPDAARRQHRSAAQRPTGLSRHRSRHCRPPRRLRLRNRQHPQRRLRPAPGLQHL